MERLLHWSNLFGEQGRPDVVLAAKLTAEEWDKYTELSKQGRKTFILGNTLLEEVTLAAHNRGYPLEDFLFKAIKEGLRALNEPVEVQDQDCGSVGC